MTLNFTEPPMTDEIYQSTAYFHSDMNCDQHIKRLLSSEEIVQQPIDKTYSSSEPSEYLNVLKEKAVNRSRIKQIRFYLQNINL